jgi:hypothetical protein
LLKYYVELSTNIVCLEALGGMIGERFTWSHYPKLENVLKAHMEEYYNMRYVTYHLLIGTAILYHLSSTS